MVKLSTNFTLIKFLSVKNILIEINYVLDVTYVQYPIFIFQLLEKSNKNLTRELLATFSEIKC